MQLELPKVISITKDKVAHLHMQGDVLEWFQTPNPIKIASSPVAMNPGSVMDIADNYSDMFTIQSAE